MCAEMEYEYGQHESRILDVSLEIEGLSRQMEDHLRAIRKLEEYHRTCNS